MCKLLSLWIGFGRPQKEKKWVASYCLTLVLQNTNVLWGVKAGDTSINPLSNIEYSVSYFTTTTHVLASYDISELRDYFQMNLVSRYHGNTIAWCIAQCTVTSIVFLYSLKNPDMKVHLFSSIM